MERYFIVNYRFVLLQSEQTGSNPLLIFHKRFDSTAQFLIQSGIEELITPSVHLDHGDSA
ncbi:MAG: hypothetical protein WCA16_00295 [Candidatus Sulfotelmatobacter sp.]